MANDDKLKLSPWPELDAPAPSTATKGGNKRAEAFRRAAAKLGISDPADLAAIVSFESAGSFDPHKVGGEGNRYRGLIQFGPEEQKKYYRPGQSFEDQLEDGVVRFFQDRFKQAGKPLKGATLEDLYTTVIAGNPNANRNAKDAFGTSARSGAAQIAKEHKPKVLQSIFGGIAPVTASIDNPFENDDDILSWNAPNIGSNTPVTASTPDNPFENDDEILSWNPQQVLTPQVPATIPETPITLEAQTASTRDIASPRVATLFTDEDQLRSVSGDLLNGLFRVDTPNGILMINPRKAKQKGITDIPAYVAQKGFADLIGKAVDVGNNTASGMVVVTTDELGNELASSVVHGPESAKKQAEIDRASFPNAAHQEVVSAQDAAARRQQQAAQEQLQIQTLGGVTPEMPFPAPSGEPVSMTAEDIDARLAQPETEQLQWEGKIDDDYAEYVKYARENNLPVMSKQQFIVDVIGKAGQGDAQATGYQTQPNVPAQQNRPQQGQQAQRQTRPGETASISRQRQVGQPTSDLNRSVIEYTAPKSITTEEDALRQALRATGELTPNEINRFIANRKRDGIKLLAQPLSVSRTIQVPYYVIAEAKGDASRVEGDIAMEQAQTPVGTAISQKKYGRLPETQAEQAIDKRIREKDYVVFQKLTEALQAPWMLMSPTAGVKFASDPSDEWLQAEKKRLKEQYGSYANAYDAEQYYQNTTGLEKTVRTFNQGARSFLKNLVGGTAKTAVFLSQLQEDNDPINQLLPDNAKIGLRNAGNIADFISRLVTSGSASTAYKEMDWVKSLDGIDRQQFFKAIQEFDKAVGDDPVLKGRFLGSLGDAGGSAASFIALGAMMPSLVTTNFWGTTRNWGQAVSGIAQMAGGGYEEGKRSGLDESTARKYGLIQGALGVTEMLGAGAELAQFLKSPGLRRQMAQALVEVGKATLREGKQEFAQEVFQTTAGKAVMEYLKDNDESTWRKLYNAVNRLPKQLSESIANEGIIAMITGSVMGGGGRALQLATQSADTTVDARPVNEIPAFDGSTTVVTSSQQPQIFTDKQGRRFEVIEDLGDKVRVRNERGGEQIRNKSGLTEVNEKTPDVSKPTASVDAEPLVQDQAVEVSTKSENIDTKSSNVDAVNIRPTLTGEAKKPVESKKQIRYREDMPSGLVDEAPLQPETLEGAKNRLKEVETELQEERRKGTTDAKMGISNERAWQAAVDRIEADPNQEVVSLDINRMKEANDTTSHTGIDKNVLAPIGAAVRKVLKANGIDERNAFRTGGDEVVVAVSKGLGAKIRDEIEKEVGVIEIVAEKDFTNDRTGESFKKGDRIPVTISGTYGSTVADAETTLGERKRLSKQANPVRRPQSPARPAASEADAEQKDAPSLASLPIGELRKRASEAGIDPKQNKAKLIKALEAKGEKAGDEKPTSPSYRTRLDKAQAKMARNKSVAKKMREMGYEYEINAPGVVKVTKYPAAPGQFEIDLAKAEATESMKAPQSEGESLKMAAGENVLDSVYDGNGVNYEQVKDVAGRVESGELEIVRLDPAGERGRIAGGKRTLEASVLLGADEASRQKASSRSGADVEPRGESRGTFDPNEDSILKMTADDSSLERFRDYGYAHTQTVLEDATSEIKEVDGQTVLELNEAGAELARRVEASATGKKVSQFYGSTYTTKQLKKLAQTAKEWADRYEEKGYTADQVKSMRDLAANLETLAEKDGAGVVYIFDFALPHETHHKLVLDALGGKAFPKQAIAELEALDIWNANPTITTPDGKSKSFNSAYPRLSKEHKAIELAAMLETGEISHSDKNRFLDIFARGILEVTTELDPVQFARILSFRRQPNVLRTIDSSRSGGERDVASGADQTQHIRSIPQDYADITTSDTQRDRTEQTDREPDERSDGATSTKGEANGERTDDPRTGERASGRTADDTKAKDEKGQRVDSGFTPGGREKTSKTPSTLRERGGIPVEDRPYTSTTNAERIAFANQILDRGIDDALEWLDTQIEDNNNNAGATAVVGIALMNALGKSGRTSELNEVADALLPMVTDAAQTVQAISIVSMFSPDTAIPYATKAAKQAGKDITPEQAKRAGDIAKRMNETVQTLGVAQNSLKAAETYNKELKKQIKELEDALNLSNTKLGEFKLKLMRQGRTIAALRRQVAGIVRPSRTRTSKEVKEKLDKIASRKDEIIANLKAKFGTPAVFRMVADVEIAEVFRMAADDTLDQDLLDYATLTLADSIGTVTPEEFKRGINVIANGQLTADELDQIHAYAVNEIHTTKSEQSETIKERARLRRAHYTAAKQYQLAQLDFKGFGVKTEAEKRLAEAIIAAGEEGQFSDEAIWHAFARLNYPTVAEQIRAFRDEFGKMPNEKDILADSERVLIAARSAIRKAQMLKKDDTLEDEDIELIKEQNRVLNREKGAVAREASNFYGGLVHTKGEITLNTVVDMRRANLLSAIKTHLVNLFGNTGFAMSEEIAKLPATTIDQIAAIFTDQRAVALTPKGIASGLKVLLSKDETLANSDWDSPGGRERAITAAKHILTIGGSLADMERHQYSESILREAYPDKKLAKWVDNYINYSFRLLGAEDALFKTYAFRRYIEEAAKVQALNEKRNDPSLDVNKRRKELTLNPTNAIQVMADDYAHLMTFQNDNPLSGFIAQVKRNRPKVKAAIETIVPYDRTPTNIVIRTLEYSPLGVPMAIYQLVGKEPSKEFRNQFTSPIREDVAPNTTPKELTKEQRKAIEREINRLWSQMKQAEFARVMGRATVGTSLFGVGMTLAALGLMAGAMGYDDDDPRERDLAWERRKQGVEPGSILLPFLGIRIQLPVSPASSALTAGATFYEQIKMAKKDTTLAVVDGAKETFADMAAKQPYINATTALLRDLRKQRYGEFTGNLLSGYVPASAMVRSISEVTDEKERTGSGYRKGEKINTTERFFKRQWRGFRNSLFKGVPGARNYWVDESTSGVSPEVRGGPFRRVIRNLDPFNTRPGVDAPVPEGQVPDNKSYFNSSEFKRATTDDIVTMIYYDRESEIDTTELEQALRKKVMNARKAGTFTAEEAKRVNDILGTNYAPRDTRKK